MKTYTAKVFVGMPPILKEIAQEKADSDLEAIANFIQYMMTRPYQTTAARIDVPDGNRTRAVLALNLKHENS